MSRLYSPEDFGKYSTLTAIIIILTVVVNGKYDLAIMGSNDTNKERKATYYGGMILTIISCLIILIIGCIVVVTGLVNYSILDIFMIVIFTFFSSNNSIINIWLNKNGFYKQISRNRIIYSLINFIGIIVLGILQYGYLGIMFSVLLAYFGQFIYVYHFLHKRTNFPEFKFSK